MSSATHFRRIFRDAALAIGKGVRSIARTAARIRSEQASRDRADTASPPGECGWPSAEERRAKPKVRKQAAR